VLAVLANLGRTAQATQYTATFILLWVVPGLAWSALLAGRDSRLGMEELVTGLGLGMGSVALLTLLLHYVPGPLNVWSLLIAVNLLTLTVTLLALRVSGPRLPFDIPRPSLRSCALIVLLAGFLRLTHLGYSEFQGDEATVMMRAAYAISGDDAQLFYHQKGPVEALFPMATWTLSGVINEWQARLPFAWASILGVAAVYLLGRRWFGERGGLAAALLLAINGYFVGFGRIVQYQSFVLAMTGLGLLAVWRWCEGERSFWLTVGGALLAFGLLAHYDAALTLPAVAYLVGRRLWRARRTPQASPVAPGAIIAAGGTLIGILAPFYVPFALHPSFGKTLGYLTGARIGAGGPLYNGLLSSLALGTFYNSTYYLASLALWLVLASFLPFQGWRLLIPASFYVLLVLLPGIWTGPVLAGLTVVVFLSSRSSSHRVAWLWFGAPFLFYYFLIWDPRTHVLNAFPGAVLLAALAIDRFVDLVPSSSRLFTSALLLVAILFLAYYPYLMFVRHDPEIKRTWPEHQPALYWRPDIPVPRFGYFGFPYRAGWKAVGTLVEQGVLDAVYASNEEQEVTDWYVRGAERTYCHQPEWYFVADDVQDEVQIPNDEVKTAYDLWGKVEVSGGTRLRIYSQHPLTATPTAYQAQAFAPVLDARTSPEQVVHEPPSDYTPAGYTLGQRIHLLGYRVNTAQSYPGGSVHLVLYWKALQPIEANYQVFTHLYDGTLWGQHDGAPACAMRPTTQWEPGRIVRDEHVIPVDPSTPVGEVPLLVGMYRLDSYQRLTAWDADGEPVGDTIPLTTVPVDRTEVMR
jgi:4-amino-4-deoxy-L-arabinose transferase-like glycosyltransferase